MEIDFRNFRSNNCSKEYMDYKREGKKALKKTKITYTLLFAYAHKILPMFKSYFHIYWLFQTVS